MANFEEWKARMKSNTSGNFDSWKQRMRGEKAPSPSKSEAAKESFSVNTMYDKLNQQSRMDLAAQKQKQPQKVYDKYDLIMRDTPQINAPVMPQENKRLEFYNQPKPLPDINKAIGDIGAKVVLDYLGRPANAVVNTFKTLGVGQKQNSGMSNVDKTAGLKRILNAPKAFVKGLTGEARPQPLEAFGFTPEQIAEASQKDPLVTGYANVVTGGLLDPTAYVSGGAIKNLFNKVKPVANVTNKVDDALKVEQQIQNIQDLSRLDDLTRGKQPLNIVNQRIGRPFENQLNNSISKSTGNSLIDSVRESVGLNNSGFIPNAGKGNIEFVVPEGQKISGFNKTIVDSVNTAPEVKQAFKDIPMTYKPVTNAESVAAAMSRINNNLEDAVQYVKMTKEPSAEHTATAIELINKFQNEGNFQRAIDIVEDITPKLTKYGQAIQAASIYDRLSPQGILVYAQRQINNLNEGRWFKGLTKEYALSGDDAANLKKLSEEVQSLTGDAKIEASQELQSALQSLGKSGIDRKLESAQSIFQLLNPRTIIRNTVGNEIFYRLERVNKWVATPIDWTRSALTGNERTVTFRTAGQSGYWEGFLKGAKAGWKGVNPSGLQTQYDLVSPAFKSKWNPMTYLEKTLNATLKGFDYASYNRAVNKTVGELAELRAINEGLKGNVRREAVLKYIREADNNLLNIADQYGKYVTFQDENLISKGLSSIKKGLNLGKEFGAGSIVMKYPKTPGALIMRGLEYSPAGFLKSAYTLAKPILKGGTINTREVTLALSRAITGSVGFTGLGWYLADRGIITGQVNKDKDVRELEKQVGKGSYKVNVSALVRWVKSGFNDSEATIKSGDTMVSYDWAQPAAMALSFGANMNQNYKEGRSLGENAPGVIAASLEGALNTITEQPVLQNLLKVMQGYNLGENITNTLKQIPASFMPTLLNQVKQYMDNTGRSTYDPNTIKEALNMVIAKTPWNKGLPVAYDTLGQPKQTYQDNSIFNVFFNPAYVSQYNPSAEAQLPLGIYERTGDKKQFPMVMDKTITYTKNKQKYKIDLTGEEYSRLQQYVGNIINNGIQDNQGKFILYGYKQLLNDKYFNEFSDERKSEIMQNIQKKANQMGRDMILTERGLK